MCGVVDYLSSLHYQFYSQTRGGGESAASYDCLWDFSLFRYIQSTMARAKSKDAIVEALAAHM